MSAFSILWCSTACLFSYVIWYVNTQAPWDLSRTCMWFWIMWSTGKMLHKIIEGGRNYTKNVSDFVVSRVPADGLAPLGARASAGTIIIKFGSRIYMQDRHLKAQNENGWHIWKIPINVWDHKIIITTFNGVVIGGVFHPLPTVCTPWVSMLAGLGCEYLIR